MQVPGIDVLGAPGGAWATHVMLFRPIGMKRRDDKLAPKIPDLDDQSMLAIIALRSRGSG